MKIKKVIDYIELNNLQKNKQAINDLCDYYELSNEGRWHILNKYNCI